MVPTPYVNDILLLFREKRAENVKNRTKFSTDNIPHFIAERKGHFV